MKPKALFLAALLAASAVQASAATVEDADGNGSYSMEEMAASYPDLTAETYAQIDADASGEVSDDELMAAMENGLVPAE
ncbi:MAG: EF-hand domain-containing protein [Roseovarius sp.]